MASWRRLIPTPLKSIYWYIQAPLYALKFGVKNQRQAAEIHFWKTRWEKEGRSLKKGEYERNMLAIAGEKDGTFLTTRRAEVHGLARG